MKLSQIMIRVFVLIMPLLFVNDCSEVPNIMEMKSLEGAWVAQLEDDMGKQVFIFLLKVENGKLTGEVHSYMGSTKLEAMQFGEIEYSPPDISILSNPTANIYYRAEVDTTKNIMSGKLIYDDGSEKEMKLTFYDQNKLSQEYPGIAGLLYETESGYQIPQQCDDELIVAPINTENIDTSIISSMICKINTGDFGIVKSVLILKDNALVFEKYFGGYYRTDLQVLYSVTKSIASLCLGIAFDQGKINSVNDKLSSYFPEYAGLTSEEWKKITIKHLLTMSMGLNWDDGYNEEFEQNGNNLIRYILSQRVKLIPGDKWEYVNPNVNLIAGIIKQSTGLHADELAEKYLFEPLGITEYNWEPGRQNGYPRMDGTLALRARDMAKIGLMMINGGKYKGRQILSKQWVDECVKYQIGIDKIFSYGYLWWRAISQSDPGTEVIYANGLGGQHIFIVPKYNLVVVTTGGNYDLIKMRVIISMVDEYIIRAVANKQIIR